MDVALYVTMVVLGFVGSFFSGLLGIGGAIINYPLLLFVPAALGIAAFSAHEVSTMSMFQVFFASLAGSFMYLKRQGAGPPLIHRGLATYMGGSILIGSVIGSVSSGSISSDAITMIYGALAVIAVLFMLLPKQEREEQVNRNIPFNKYIAVMSAFGVGIASGIVGAGGSFILIPVMITVLKIPTRTTIATSLVIVFISSVGGVIGKISYGNIPIMATLFVIIGSVLGAPLGSKVSPNINVKLLHYGLVILIAATSVKIWASVLG
ncbi:sulfite exporter TauE/SafE family protein [Paenibacillus sp. 481]|uniref:sulfite exporter TauE/SafE family protein n=1 Tax=Paenibacillus sp. 481 TaxID=2835869 RepID=UPI001E4FD0E9|nr:sulfite exporter TauE/SafE family protein [Paenibacillus sp. 481]UHA76073.1 sulfite exporter TauE/SafE family protein [Paenibacillus sp. 481]